MSKTPEKLYYSIEGIGSKLVLIHGFLETNHMWEPLQLEKNFTCIKVELPGHGACTVKNSDQTISFIAQCLRLTLESIGVVEFDLIGHSLGGYVALEYIHQYGLPGKLILFHSNFWEDDEQKKIDRQRIAKIVLKNKNLFLNEALPALFVEPKKHFLVINNLILEAKKIKSEAISDSSLAMQKRADHRKIVEKNSEVISIIQGENDRLVPMAKMKDMTRGFNNEIIIIPKAGHMGQHENTKAVSKAIEKILK